MAEPHQERWVPLEHVEAGPVESLVELGLAHVSMVAVAEPLEACGRSQPAEGPGGCPEPLRASRSPTFPIPQAMSRTLMDRGLWVTGTERVTRETISSIIASYGPKRVTTTS